MFAEMRRKGISGDIRRFDEKSDDEFKRMKMIATLHAEETMKRGANERDNPSTFLA
jgi:hypothetical protein